MPSSESEWYTDRERMALLLRLAVEAVEAVAAVAEAEAKQF